MPAAISRPYSPDLGERVVAAVMPWRDLPERHGPSTTAYNLFNRWSRRGIWSGLGRGLKWRHLGSKLEGAAHCAATPAHGRGTGFHLALYP
jgi:hypothetical protein